MAATLTVAGLLLIRVRDKLSHSLHHRRTGFGRALERAARLGPVIASSLVLAVGLGLTVRVLTAA